MADPIQIQVRKPHTFKRYYEFWLQERLIAVLDYEKMFSSQAIISIGDHKWKIKTTGFWKKNIEIAAEQSPYTKMRIAYGWNYRLSFSADNKQTYNLKTVGFWKRTWTWFDENENTVIEMKSNQLSKKNRGQISLHQPPSNHLFFIMMLGWYQLITHEEHTAASAAA